MIGVRDRVALRHGAMECLLSPGCGGSIAAWRWSGPSGTLDLFRPASEAAMAGDFAPDMACFPLIPFSNRVAGGRFTFQGRRVEMPTDPGSPHRIHGHGWAVPWRVEGQTASAARLTFRHRADSWPWSYSAAQTIALDDDGLTVELELVNESDNVMPAGFGLHPYFPKPPGTRVTARLTGVWDSDETILPRTRHALPPAWNFPKGVAMDGVVLDNGFTGWDGTAVLAWPGRGPGRGLSLTMVADGPFGHLIVYAPAGEDYLCLEPVSHMTDALNRPQEPDAGVVALPPGERLTGTVRFRVAAL